ncbi:hypothetical protein WJX82_004618 [Trebouxia sp. C0006]
MVSGKEQLTAQTMLDQAALDYPSHLVIAAAYQGLLAHWLCNFDCYLTDPQEISTTPHGKLTQALFLQPLQPRDCY